MADMKHTPGPWRENEHGNFVCYSEGLEVGILSSQLPKEEREANKRVILAAPELLSLSLQYRDDLRHPPSPDSRELRLAAIDAAIAKAEGRS